MRSMQLEYPSDEVAYVYTLPDLTDELSSNETGASIFLSVTSSKNWQILMQTSRQVASLRAGLTQVTGPLVVGNVGDNTARHLKHNS